MAQFLVLNQRLVSIFVQTYPGQIAETVRYWEVTALGGPGGVDTDDVAAALDGAFAQPYKDILCNTASWYGVQVRISRPTNNGGWVYSKAHSGVGVAGATPLATQTTGLLRFHTNWFGPQGQGRIYLPFPATADQSTDGTPSAGYLTRAQAIGDLFESPMTVTAAVGGGTAQLQPIIFKPLTNNPLPITVAVPADAWATQKSRGSFGRSNPLPW